MSSSRSSSNKLPEIPKSPAHKTLPGAKAVPRNRLNLPGVQSPTETNTALVCSCSGPWLFTGKDEVLTGSWMLFSGFSWLNRSPWCGVPSVSWDAEAATNQPWPPCWRRHSQIELPRKNWTSWATVSCKHSSQSSPFCSAGQDHKLNCPSELRLHQSQSWGLIKTSSCFRGWRFTLRRSRLRNIPPLEIGAGERRRCENVPYQFEVLNAADEIGRVRPAAFDINAIFKNTRF